MSKFELYKDDKKEWRWRFKSTNGRVISSGEGYKNKKDCVAAVKLLQTSAEAKIEIKK